MRNSARRYDRRVLTRLRTRLELLPPLSRREKQTTEQIDTLVLPIGPYRNLTTLTAAVFALHPECLVLNHAAARLLSSTPLDFLSEPTEERRRTFTRAAVRLLQKGRRGIYGGSILHSHAFEDGELLARYRDRFGYQHLKPQGRVLFWKDSMRILQHIWESGQAPEAYLQGAPRIRFLLPVRHPVHCLRSNLRGHWKILHPQAQASPRALMDQMMKIIRWAVELQQSHPKAVLLLWEQDWGEPALEALRDFLDLQPDERWVRDILSTAPVRPRPTSNEDADLLRSSADAHFADMPEMRDRLLTFVS